MIWFDPPAIALRKRVPLDALSGFNVAEEYALYHLSSEPSQNKPYQVGVVLALWIKAGELTGEIAMSRRDSNKVQSIYESCMKVLRQESHIAFCILAELAEKEQMFEMPADFYRQLSLNVLGAL